MDLIGQVVIVCEFVHWGLKICRSKDLQYLVGALYSQIDQLTLSLLVSIEQYHQLVACEHALVSQNREYALDTCAQGLGRASI